MSKKVTFFIASNSGSHVKQVSVSKLLLTISCLGVIGCFIGAGFLLYDYAHLKNTYYNNRVLTRKVASLEENITNQHKQIQIFASDINTFKVKLIELKNFEKKIRIIANLEKDSDQNTFFGVGGSIPDDLNTNFPVLQKHNSLLREMHEQVEEINLASIAQKDNLEDLLKYLEDQKNMLASTPAIWPTKGWITSRFGYRKSPFTSKREFHKGLDIAARNGTPIVATADGVVTFEGKKGYLGNAVIIDHGHGMVTRYGHTSKNLVKRGDKVKRGDVIAEIGSTGRSTGPHVHYDIRLNGVHVNPEKYIIN